MTITRRKAILVASFVLLFAVIAIVAVRLEDKLLGTPADPEIGANDYLNERNTVYFDGEAYIPRPSLSTYLLIGLDKSGVREESDSYLNDAQADYLTLLLVDRAAKTYTVLSLNRDTMTTVEKLGLGGQSTGSTTAQLALAHTYGSGLADSAENTARAVSTLLYGVGIDGYLSLTMDAVPLVADAVGGVTLTLDASYTELNPGYTAGATVTLRGEDALDFIRARGGMAEPTNLARMERQKAFITALLASLREKKLHSDDLSELLQTLTPYMVTDADTADLQTVLAALTEYDCAAVLTPDGEAQEGAEFIEFYTDDAKLKQMVASLFYEKQ